MVRNVLPWLQSATPIPACLFQFGNASLPKQFSKDNLPPGRLFLPSPPFLTGNRLRPGVWMRVQPQPSRHDRARARSIGAQRKSHSSPKRGTQASFLKKGDIAESGDGTPRHGSPGMQDVARDRGKQLTTGGSGPKRILQDFKPGSHGQAMRPLEPDAYCGCSVRQTMQMQPRSTKTWNVGGHTQTHLTSK